MKHYFFCAFLSLFLASCGGGGGGGDSTSSSKKAKAAKACTTPIPNGKGELPWNTKTKKYSTTCKVVSCNAGYVKNTEGNSCDGETKACMTPIPNGKGELLWNTKTKKYSTTCKVVSCNAGYVKNTGENTCDIPDTGKYADSSGDEQSCDAITLDPGGFNTFLLNTGAVETATGCGFSCNAGFLKSGRACNFPRKGKYVAGSGSEGSCGDVGGTLGGFNEFLDNIKGVNSASGCNFSCKSGYVKSASGYTCTQGYPCSIDNGAGVKTTSSSTTCQVVDCDAGYDSTQAPTTQCQQTASGHYSLANNKGRTACPTPPHSSATTTTELSSADGCYTCDGGYLKNTARNTCDVPSKGTYVNASGTEVSCNPITTLQGGATATWIRGAAATADACPFSCSPGFVKTGRACNIPGLGKYADSSGDEQSCNNPTGAAGGFDTFLPNTGAVDSATGCGFSCNAGFMKDSSARQCNYPTKGNYVNNQGAEASCDSITIEGGATATWIAGAAATDATCPYSCSSGFVKTGRACNTPDTGKYAGSSGDEQSCEDPTGAAGGFKEFLSNTGAVSTAAGCDFTCNAGFVKKTVGRTCATPDTGKYGDAGIEKSCDNPTGDTGGFNIFLPNSGAVSSATGCGFSCNAGFVKDSSARECNYPSSGNYVNNLGAEVSCNRITTEGTAIATWIAGAASTAPLAHFPVLPVM